MTVEECILLDDDNKIPICPPSTVLDVMVESQECYVGIHVELH